MSVLGIIVSVLVWCLMSRHGVVDFNVGLERKCVLDYIDYVMCRGNGGTKGLLVELDDSGS